MDVVVIVNLVSLIFLEFINRKIYQHIQRHYPTDWLKFSEEKMGVKVKLSRPIAVRDAIHSGHFAGEHAPQLNRYVTIQKYIVIWAALSVFTALIWWF